MSLRPEQKAQIRAMVNTPYFSVFKQVIDDMIAAANVQSTVGQDEFHTTCLSVRRDERIVTLNSLVTQLEKYASESIIK